MPTSFEAHEHETEFDGIVFFTLNVFLYCISIILHLLLNPVDPF